MCVDIPFVTWTYNSKQIAGLGSQTTVGTVVPSPVNALFFFFADWVQPSLRYSSKNNLLILRRVVQRFLLALIPRRWLSLMVVRAGMLVYEMPGSPSAYYCSAGRWLWLRT